MLENWDVGFRVGGDPWVGGSSRKDLICSPKVCQTMPFWAVVNGLWPFYILLGSR